MKLEDGDLEKPFCVEFGPDPDEDAEADERFATEKEAQDFAEDKALSHKAVWVSEIGTYETSRHRLKSAWMYYWWSPSTWSDMAPVGRGTGFPDFQGTKPVPYTPYVRQLPAHSG